MRKIKILTNGNFSEKQGINTFITQFLKNESILTEFGFKGLDLYFSGKKTIYKKKKTEIKSIKKAQYKSKIKSLIYKFPLLSFLVVIKIRVIPGILNSVKMLLSSDKKDIIFCQDFYSAFFYKGKAKLFMVIHSGERPLDQIFFNFPCLKNTFFEKAILFFFKKALFKCNKVFVLSNLTARHLESTFNFKNSIVINNGVASIKPLFSNFEFNLRSKSTIKLLCIGSLSFRKGIDILLESVSKIKNDSISFEINIIGDGNQKSNLLKLINLLELTSKVNFLGEIEDVYPFLYSTDLYILPSREEGLPMSVLEAMSIGVPSILSLVGSIPEAISKEAFIPVSPNVESMVNVLTNLISFKYDTKSISSIAVNEFENKFDSKVMVANYLNVFNEN